MGYYKDTGSLQSMASAEAILKKRMPEKNGNSIRRAIDRGGTAGGYHWEYLDEKRR